MNLREAAQQALEALEGVITDLRAAKAESERDWSLLEATQESLREHMAEIQRLRAALAQPANIAEWWAAKQAASGEQATAWTCNCPACGARLFCSCAARRKR